MMVLRLAVQWTCRVRHKFDLHKPQIDLPDEFQVTRAIVSFTSS